GMGLLLAVDGVTGLGTDRPRAYGREVGGRHDAPFVGTDVERHAVAQFPGVGDLVGAVGAGVALVLGLVQRLERVVTRRARDVGERLGVAEREARPLDEGAGRVERDRAL